MIGSLTGGVIARKRVGILMSRQTEKHHAFSKMGKGFNAEWIDHVPFVVQGVMHTEGDQTNAPGPRKRERALGN